MQEIMYFGYANGYLTKITQYAWSIEVEQKIDGVWIPVYPDINNLDVSDLNYVKFTVAAGTGPDPDPEAGKMIVWKARKAIIL